MGAQAHPPTTIKTRATHYSCLWGGGKSHFLPAGALLYSLQNLPQGGKNSVFTPCWCMCGVFRLDR